MDFIEEMLRARNEHTKMLKYFEDSFRGEDSVKTLNIHGRKEKVEMIDFAIGTFLASQAKETVKPSKSSEMPVKHVQIIGWDDNELRYNVPEMWANKIRIGDKVGVRHDLCSDPLENKYITVRAIIHKSPYLAVGTVNDIPFRDRGKDSKVKEMGHKETVKQIIKCYDYKDGLREKHNYYVPAKLRGRINIGDKVDVQVVGRSFFAIVLEVKDVSEKIHTAGYVIDICNEG